MARLSSPSLELKTVNFIIDQFTTKGLLKSEQGVVGERDTCPGR